MKTYMLLVYKGKDNRYHRVEYDKLLEVAIMAEGLKYRIVTVDNKGKRIK